MACRKTKTHSEIDRTWSNGQLQEEILKSKELWLYEIYITNTTKSQAEPADNSDLYGVRQQDTAYKNTLAPNRARDRIGGEPDSSDLHGPVKDDRIHPSRNPQYPKKKDN